MSKIKITYEFEPHEVDLIEEHHMLHGKWFGELLDEIRKIKQLADTYDECRPSEDYKNWSNLYRAINRLDYKRGEYP